MSRELSGQELELLRHETERMKDENDAALARIHEMIDDCIISVERMNAELRATINIKNANN